MVLCVPPGVFNIRPVFLALLTRVTFTLTVDPKENRHNATSILMKLLNSRSFQMRTIARATGWLLVAAIVTMSVIPASSRPVSGAGQNSEHFLVYLATGLAFGFGYAPKFWRLAFSLLTFSAGIELAQLLVPGRHARMSDFLVDATAAWLGLLLSWLSIRSLTCVTG